MVEDEQQHQRSLDLDSASVISTDQESFTDATESIPTDTDLEKHSDDEKQHSPALPEKTTESVFTEGLDEKVPASGEGDVKIYHRSISKMASHASHKSDVGMIGDVETQGSSSTSRDDDHADEDDDPNIVWWDGESDPANPYNWPKWTKVVNCSVIAFLTFITPLASAVFAPGVPELMADFGSDSRELASFVVSVYVLGFAFGPLLIAPLSEIYGRAPVYHVCNVGFVAFLAACALAPGLGSLIAFRFLSGVFGSCPLTNGGGSIADMVRQESRGAAMAAFSLGPLIGPIIGPVAGGFLTAAKGWRWVFWVLVIAAGSLAVVMLLCMRETYAPLILQRKTERLRKETGNELLRSKLDAGLSKMDFFKRSIVRPLKMLVRSPIVALFSIYITVVYGYLYIMFTSITEVFQGYYHFSTQAAGLAFLGLGVGFMMGLVLFSATSDRHLKKMAARDGQGMKPEYRLHALPVGAMLMPAGFFIYGWTAQYRVHWIVPIMGHAIIGMGNMIIFMAQQM